MKLYYMGYYGDTLNDRKSAPSADTKVDYMLDTLKECFSEIEFLSFCNTNNRNCIFKKYPGYLIKKNGNFPFFTLLIVSDNDNYNIRCNKT